MASEARLRRWRWERRKAFAVAVFLVGVALAVPSTASATVGWEAELVAEPSHFASSDRLVCETEAPKCDSYQVLVANVGDSVSEGAVQLTDTLPAGIVPSEPPKSGHNHEGAGNGEWNCSEVEGANEIWTVSCELPVSEPIPAGGYAPWLDIPVSPPAASLSGTLKSRLAVSGGGAATGTVAENDTPVSGLTPPFALAEFGWQADIVGGAPSVEAGGHPWALTAVLGLPSSFSPRGEPVTYYHATENLRSVIVELPAGFVGNPQATERCRPTQLRAKECPAGSKVGTFALLGGAITSGEFRFTGYADECCSAIYNMVPEGGYPAEFAFAYAQEGIIITMYPSVVHTPEGYRLRITVPGIPTEAEARYAAVTFFGDPSKLDGGSMPQQAFLTNPTRCSNSGTVARSVIESWEAPNSFPSKEATAYSAIADCKVLHFDPTLEFAPSNAAEQGTGVADSPSAYTTTLNVPQSLEFAGRQTPAVKNVSVTLPVGVSLNPAAAQGLAGCRAVGPEGINIGTRNAAAVGALGQDFEDPEAAELGAGHPGGNGSQYDDGIYHTAAGHCPSASTVGTAEAFTPLLPDGPGGSAPLKGHVYVAEPRCGEPEEQECSEASATNGELFGLYLELTGSGVIIKVAGTVSANPSTGQLQATFADDPELPFSSLRLQLHGGPRAPLANPQQCGAFTALGDIAPWSSPATPDSRPSSTFAIGGCGDGAFNPVFDSYIGTPVAGASSSFVMTVARHDGEQNLSRLAVTLPPGLLGKITGVPLCPSEQAGAGMCSAESQIGSLAVAAGSGDAPLALSGGRVYLTGPYKGQPYGLSIVVPASAGPFDLGDVVTRAAIHVDPRTAQVTIISDSLPSSKDGVPFRLRSVIVNVTRPGFILNPTNCQAHAVEGNISGEDGGDSATNVPFAVQGCGSLVFRPTFTATTKGPASKANGTSLDAKLTYPSLPVGGGPQSNVNLANLKVELPKQLPSRLTTLQKSCVAATFNANPAACPPTSAIGTVRVMTPILPDPLEGPAYLVSHGGEAFPQLIMVLQGDAVTIDVVGTTSISKKGITSETFSGTPDAPFTSFDIRLPAGKYSVLAANLPPKAHYDMCGQKLSMPIKLTAQNGVVIQKAISIAVIGCPHAVARGTRKKTPKPKQARHRRNRKR